MGFFDFNEAKDARDQVYSDDYPEDHQSKFSHELVGGAAAFEAMHLWEKKQREEGNNVSHGFAKEALAGLAGAEADKLFETKGLDFIDREKAKHQAKRQVEQLYDNQYGDRDQYSPDYDAHETMQGNYQGGY
ncbi:hypothetical protein B0T26DRAFT_748604 [Lasiosphaeria miniovina]|uniref:CipC-like antibiotic response protein n=1 Tax=Lasiosphaeria miniovina TaxID=1954250 RepID=A0AA40E4Y7_9PEZI|nr:uncharacterized protein B0T26DRAFT_748604 [Lasiosphaeria miniovina]KAK0728374.1 hypothetical protein B0T26DRAFT_748604 [Lasiosphaeria miniovina]